jgi:hypothetical protein
MTTRPLRLRDIAVVLALKVDAHLRINGTAL